MAEATRRPATLRDLGDGFVCIWVAYEDKERAKALPGARWDKGLKGWRVPKQFEGDALCLVDRLNTAGHRPPTQARPPALASALAALLRSVPSPELRERTYRALVKVWHPDKGGDVRLTQALNEAWREVRR